MIPLDHDASEISASEARELVTRGEAWLLDVREQYEWDAGHAASAHHIPMGALQPRLHELPDDTPLLVICHVGGRSDMVARALRGIDYIALNVRGGMLAWQQAGGEVLRADGSSGTVV